MLCALAIVYLMVLCILSLTLSSNNSFLFCVSTIAILTMNSFFILGGGGGCLWNKVLKQLTSCYSLKFSFLLGPYIGVPSIPIVKQQIAIHSFFLFFLLHLDSFNFNLFALFLPQYLSNYFLSVISVFFVLQVWNISLSVHCFIWCVWPLCYTFSLSMLSQIFFMFQAHSNNWSYIDPTKKTLNLQRLEINTTQHFYYYICICIYKYITWHVIGWVKRLFSKFIYQEH